MVDRPYDVAMNGSLNHQANRAAGRLVKPYYAVVKSKSQFCVADPYSAPAKLGTQEDFVTEVSAYRDYSLPHISIDLDAVSQQVARRTNR